MDRNRDTQTISYDDDVDDRWRATGWAELPFFLAAARSGTLRAAADRMKVNHATVDRNIKSLEDAYGVSLFERNPRGLTLTAEGIGLLAKAEEAEMAVLQAKRAATGFDATPAGPVHLSLSSWHSTYDFPRFFEPFRAQFPGIDLRISVSDRLEDISRSPIDISLRAAWRIEADVIGRKIGTYKAAVLASRAYLEKHWDARGSNGKGLHWIGKSTLWPNPELDALDPFPNAERTYDVRDPLMINTLLAEGHGMAIVPLGARHYFPQLEVVPGTPIVDDRTLWVIYHSDLKHAARIRAVSDYLFEMMSKALGIERKMLAELGA